MSESDIRAAALATAELFEGLGTVREVVEGHRADMQRRGFSETASEQMAVAFHNEMVAMIFRSNKP